MNKKGQEELGPHISLTTLMYTLLSIAVLIFLIFIFTKFIQ